MGAEYTNNIFLHAQRGGNIDIKLEMLTDRQSCLRYVNFPLNAHIL